jgi:hypothetical protein
MSFAGNKPGRFFDPWFNRRRLTIESFGLPWFFLLSALIHAAVLWQFPYIPPHTPRPFSSSNIVVVTRLESDLGALSSTESSPSKGPLVAHTRSLTRDRPVTSSGSDKPASSPSDSSATAGGDGSVGLGNALTDGGGVGAGGLGIPSGSGGAGQSGTGSGAGSGTTKGKPGSSSAKAAPPGAGRFAIAIPPAIQRTTSPYESEVYAEIDFYTLFTPDLRSSVNVPANQVCLEGDVIRTYERQVISHTITDISKCRYEDYSDGDQMRCPKEAHTTVVTYSNFLSSPVNYKVNVCMAYDRSSCYWDMKDDGPEREICRIPGKYEGLWAEGTMFHYPCAKSSNQSFSHPLQYEVRYMQDVEFPDERMRRRLVLREKRPLAQCQ